MKFWWLLGLVLFLIVAMTFRESFVSYADALKDVGQTAGYTSLTPKCPEGSSLNAEKTMCKFTDTKKADVVPTCSSDTLEFVGSACVPKPGAGTSTGGSTTAMGVNSTGASTGATGTTSGTETPPKCADGTDYKLYDHKYYECKDNSKPTCPAGTTFVIISPASGESRCVNPNRLYPAAGPSKSPREQCNGNDKPLAGNKCLRSSSSSEGSLPTTTGSGATPSTSTTGSGVTPSTVKKSGLLGPAFTSYGAPITPGNPDSYKTTKYPELLGGGDPAARNREQGGGFDLQGSLPTMDGLGATEASKYFPFSRQPGDMELIPDPYRVSQQFSSASYSFKTEPTPFLTDFSAFLR